MRGRGDGGGRGGKKNHCQVCGKTWHSALCRYKCFNVNYTGEERHANATTTSSNVDTDWYTNAGATDHITSELDKLTTREKYGGSNQVQIANGSGMPIAHITQSTIHTHDHILILKYILHFSDASKNLVSVHKFTYDNNTFFNFTLGISF
jgi:hypothetical protein